MGRKEFGRHGEEGRERRTEGKGLLKWPEIRSDLMGKYRVSRKCVPKD